MNLLPLASFARSTMRGLLSLCLVDPQKPHAMLPLAALVFFWLSILRATAFVDASPVGHPVSVVAIAPNALDFGSQAVGTASPKKTAVLTNTGKSVLTIHDVTVSGIDFGESNTCQGSLAPGANCTIAVTFKPAITGPRLGTIIITDSDVASPHMLVMSGVGQ
jgi:Transmembrane protein 131-like N-terminal